MSNNNSSAHISNASGYAKVNGIDMYYEIHGEGKPLVLIHGGGSTINSTFGNILPLLATHNTIVAVELQAHGRTGDRNAPETFEQDADDVAALLQHLSISQASFFGFSNGGNTAMQIAARHPDMVQKLVIASAFYKREGMVHGFFDGLEQATLNDMPAPLHATYLQVNNDTNGFLAMFEKDRQRMLHFKDWTDETLISIKAPCLVIAGDRDVVMVEHTVKMSHLLPYAELLILPADHGAYIGEICSAQNETKLVNSVAEIIIAFLEK